MWRPNPTEVPFSALMPLDSLLKRLIGSLCSGFVMSLAPTAPPAMLSHAPHPSSPTSGPLHSCVSCLVHPSL